jgi:hypothetical protein
VKKPTVKKGPEYLDYHECNNYIEKKYNIQTRDFLGKFQGGKANDVEYLDFWHWMCDNFEISNGAIIHVNFEELRQENNPPDWVKHIFTYWEAEFKDFADKDNYLAIKTEW